MKIGYIRERYPEKRNIIGRAGSDNEYVFLSKARNKWLLFTRGCEIIAGRVLKRQNNLKWNRHAVYRPIKSPRVDVIHTFNTVCDCKTPWVCTFETAVPRTAQTVRRDWMNSGEKADGFTENAFELLRSKSCLALIALSQSNKSIQTDMMEALGIEGREEITAKIIVLPPPQPVLISSAELAEKFDSVCEKTEFIFVGGDFFRKGGAQLVDALCALSDKFSFHLTVISTLNYDDYASKATLSDMERYKKMLESKPFITYYEKLPNSEVLELCKKSHIGLLPTMADTYGYSVLEMQACGCAVVTTDVRALPEMNNDACGYICKVPKHASGEARYDTPEERGKLKRIIENELGVIFREILTHPEDIKAKAEKAVAKIAEQHSPDKYKDELMKVYTAKSS